MPKTSHFERLLRGGTDPGYIRLPSRKRVPKSQYGFHRYPSSVSGPMAKGGEVDEHPVIKTDPQEKFLGALSHVLSAIGRREIESLPTPILENYGRIDTEKEGKAEGGEIKKIPQKKFLGALSRVVKAIDEGALAPTQRALGRIPLGFTGAASEYTGGQREGLAGMLVPRLGNLGQVLEEASYGMPLTTGRGMTTGIKPEVGMATIEASQIVPTVKAGAVGAKALGRAAKEKLPGMATRLAEKYPLAAAPVSPLYAVKPQGGQWLPEESSYLIPRLSTENIAARKWAQKQVPRYVEKYLGSTGDPLADIRIPYKGGLSRWEEMTDPLVESTPASVLSKEYVPEWIKKLPGETPVYQLAAGEPELGSSVQGYIRKVLEYAETVPPEKLQQYDFPRLVKEFEKKQAEKAEKAAKDRLSGHRTLPKYKEYPEGYRWEEIRAPEEGLTSQHMERVIKQPDGTYHAVDAEGKLIRGTGELSKDFKAIGKTPEEAFTTGRLIEEGEVMGHCVGGYCPDVMEGRKRILSLRDPKGKSHVTVELNPRRLVENNEEGIIDIEQIQGAANKDVLEKYRPYVRDLLETGPWGEVAGGQGLSKVGLVQTEKTLHPKEIEALRAQGVELKKFITQDERKSLQQQLYSPEEMDKVPLPLPGERPFKKGGSVKCMSGNCGCLNCLKREFYKGGPVKKTVDIKEPKHSYPIVRHEFRGDTAEEALHYLNSHKKSDDFMRDCLARGKYKDVSCTAKRYADGGSVAQPTMARYLRNVSLHPEAERVLPSVSYVESRHNPKAIGPQTKYGRAMGQYQMLSTTAKDLGVDPMEPTQARGGAHRYLSWLIGQTGSLKNAIAAYNMGLGNFKKLGDNPKNWPKETQDYVDKVMALFAKQEVGQQPTLASAPVNQGDTSPQPDPKAINAKEETPADITAPSGPSTATSTIGGGGSGPTPKFQGYNRISDPMRGSMSAGNKNPMEMVEAIMKDPLALSMMED